MIRNLVVGVVGAFLLAWCPTFVFAQDYVPGEVLVKLRGRPGSQGTSTFMGKATSQKGMALRRSWAGLNMHKFAMKAGSQAKDVEALVAELEQDPDVEYAEPNYYMRKQSTGMEGQPMSLGDFQSLAGGSLGTMSQTGASIDAEAAWDIVTPSLAPIVVAVIDTGVDYDHTVFTTTGAIWTNPLEVAGNGIDDDGNGYVDDIHGWNFVDNSNTPWDDDGHGTHVAGIVLGTTEDIRQSPPAAAIIRIMPLKFLDASGVGATSDAIEAIYYASNNGAKVLNNSWGGGGFSNSLLDAIHYSYSKKVVFVAAAGNASNNNDAVPTYPASYAMPNMISVAASTDWDSLASFSNFGALTVHLGSPGSSILSTVPNNTFSYASGTSMATPFVSGVAALMLREAPTMNGYQIKNLLFGGAEAIKGLSGKVSTASRLNVYNSVLKTQSTSADPAMPAYDSNSNSRAVASSGANMSPSGCGLVAKQVFDSSGKGGDSGGPGPQRNMTFFGLLIVLVAPILLSAYLRSRNDGRSRRRHTRYVIDSQVRVRVGDKELVGNVSTISLGGVQLNTDVWLQQGGTVKMQIESPDGKDMINVEGRVVWSEEQKRYGVAFQNTEDTALASISRWTQSLLKAS